MRQGNEITRDLGKTLHMYFDDIVNDPLPKRLVDLINILKEKGDKGVKREAKPSRRS